ncbi:MAG: hypothetical protein EHM64_12770, partial [Ignavibacteriae bacterium]
MHGQKRNILRRLMFSCWILSLAGWQQMDSQNLGEGVSLRAIALADANIAIAVGDSGTLARSTDMGGSWSMWRAINGI